VVFWSSALLLGYVYVGYPVLIWVWAALRARPARRAREEPEVSVLIVVHNEAAHITGRLENLLALDYPSDRLEIVLASDGSTDATVELARAWEPAGVTVIAFETRRGKPAVLNDLVPKARGEIVVLADARQRFDRGVIRALVGRFSDPGVGAVSGELVLTTGEGTALGQGVGFYWLYEKFIRRHESAADSTVGATGALYAIRQELFESIPEDTILDDVLIPLRITRRGYRVLFEPAACAWDRVSARAQEELARKIRTLAGNFQLFARERWLLRPRHNRLWLQTVSHKGLRLLTPLFHATAIAANLPMAGSRPYRDALLVQAIFYAAALGGYGLRNAKRPSPLLSVPYAVCLLNWATVVGFLRFIAGRQRVTWDKSERGFARVDRSWTSGASRLTE
jgi:cellulose synthase/poly-beta-1,6-N-acetylglucosamine synthase-like glycosyltransferase